MSNANRTSRRFCFTLNNPTEGWVCPQGPDIRLAVWQFEQGTSGTTHVQGYVELSGSHRRTIFNKPIYAELQGAHWEACIGTRFQNLQYVTKEESRIRGPFSYGIPEGTTLDEFIANANPGQSSTSNGSKRLLKCKELIDQGKTSLEIAESDFSTWVRNHRAFEHYRMLMTPGRTNIESVVVIYGPTGTGKSHFSMEQHPNAYWKSRGQWWDGYTGQSSVVIDEFYGWLPWDLLLRLCDKYPLLLETKGGTVQFIGKHIIFTTNKHPSLWYESKPGMSFVTFARRVTQWIYMESSTDHHHFSNYGTFAAATGFTTTPTTTTHSWTHSTH